MLGVAYLIICTLIGKEMACLLYGKHVEKKERSYHRLWITLPVSFGTGTLLITWAVYIAAWLLGVCAGQKEPLFGANLLILGCASAFLAVLYRKRWKRKGRLLGLREGSVDKKALFWECFFFLLLAGFIGYMMFYTFHINGEYLYSGFTVYGDYAPHTAMMRSFSRGNNFPTQYPHFGGEDVKYHFMFQFLCGNLEYLGMPIDAAYNLPSILSLLGFFMMLYMLSARITGSRPAGALAVFFTIFRSGTAFFRFSWEHLQAGDLIKTWKENTSFIGYTPNEDWGLWNFNVYLNQRHLAFGMILVCMAIWVYLDWLRAGADHQEQGFFWLKNRLFSKTAWRSRDFEQALLVGLFLGLCSFWNGAAVIAGLLILLGFGIFSDGKLDYGVTAAVAVFLTLIQSRIFVRGSVVKTSFYWGFLAEDKGLAGILWYLFSISGITFLGMAVLLFFLNRKERMALVGFVMPLIFAFTMSLTPDINVNHKYIMITWAFLVMYWAQALGCLWKKGIPGKIGALLLAIFMTATGIYDFAIIIKDNDSGHRVAVKEEGPLTIWLEDNLDKKDLILTPEYSIHEVTMSGAMLYLGWPYYPWSAGYDTYDRAEKAVDIYTTGDKSLLSETVEKEGITYILYEEGMEFEQHPCREDVIASLYQCVYTSEDGRIRIYDTKNKEK